MSDRLVRAKQANTEILDGEAVIHVEGTHSFHVLNRTASLVWQNLDGSMAVDEVAAMLSDAAGAPYEVVLTDVLTTVRSFGALGLLDGVHSTEPLKRADPPPEGDPVPGTDLRFLPEPPHG